MATEIMTATAVQQAEVEQDCRALYCNVQRPVPADYDDFLSSLVLQREKHVRYLLRGLKHLAGSYGTLDASRPWLCYWILHSLAILGRPLTAADEVSHCADFLRRCQDPGGGFGGGPGQLPHLAPTYAATSALVTLGSDEALHVIDRMHEDGEVDVRGCYTALAVAHILNMLTPELTDGVSTFVRRCQTYEGGMGGEPGAEAHGGYTFCGLASALLLGCAHELDLPALLRWAVHRQGTQEGGFQGRTNKLVDGCYSYWQGALFSLFQHPHLQRLLRQQQQSRYCAIIPASVPACTSVPGCGEPGVAGRAPGRKTSSATQDQSGASVPTNPPSSTNPPSATSESSDNSPPAASVHAVELEAAAWLFAGSDCLTDVVEKAFHERATAEAAASLPRRRPVLLEVEPECPPCHTDASRQQTGDASRHHTAGQPPVVPGEQRVFPVGAGPSPASADAATSHAPSAGGDHPTPASVGGAARGSAGPSGFLGEGAGSPGGGNRGNLSHQGSRGPRASVDAGDVTRDDGSTGAAGGEAEEEEGGAASVSTYFNVLALQGYLLVCCQVPEGGLRDKPGKSRDYYHTCYCLSGLAAAQHTREGPSASSRGVGAAHPLSGDVGEEAPLPPQVDAGDSARVEVLGSPSTNQVERTDPLCNLHEHKYERAVAFYKQLPSPATWT
eukprot:jgi/Mesvir1/1208/Mv17695-RA.2